MAIFKGAGVAIVTPMYEDGKVNYDKLEELLEYQIANSTDAIIIWKLILISWMRCWKSRSLAELMRSSSVEQPVNPLP